MIRRLIENTPTVSFVVACLFQAVFIYFLIWLRSHPEFIEAQTTAITIVWGFGLLASVLTLATFAAVVYSRLMRRLSRPRAASLHCDHCSRRYPTERQLEVHIRRRHPKQWVRT